MSNTKAAALNRAFNNADATVAAQAATVADLAANEIAAANKFDVATLTDAALAKQVMTNMGFLPSTVAAITQLEIELAAYFGGMGKGNRGYVVLQLSDILSTLTADATYGAIATAWNTEVAASVINTTVQTSALTASTTDSLAGGSGDDIFSGVLSLLASTNTLNVKDVIVGGAGDDTFNLTMGTAFTGFSTGSISGVEKIALTNSSTTARDFDATGISGVTTYTLDGTNAGFTLTDLAAGVATINLSNQASGTLTTAFASGVTAPDEVALGLSSVGRSATTSGTGSATSVTITPASYADAVVTVTGANVVSFGGTLDTITMSGTGSATVGAVPTTLTEFDASGTTGAVTVVTTAVTAANSLTTVKTSATAAGSITASADDLSANATISGGAATTDALVYSSAGTTNTVEYTMAGVDTLTVGAVTSAMTFSGRKTTDLANISTTSTTLSNVSFVNMGAKNLSFTSLLDSQAGNVTSDHTGTTSLTYSANATKSALYTATAKVADYTFSDAAGALSVAVSAYVDTNGSDITASKASSINLTVASGKDGSSTPVEITEFDSTITGTLATSFTVNATGKLASAAVINAPVATTGTITNGSTAGTLSLITPALTTLTVTTANALDLETDSDSYATLQNLTIATSKGLVEIGTAGSLLTKAANITLSGAGTTSAVTLGALGATTNDYDMTIAVSGLTAGLTTGALSVGGGYDLTVNADDALGNVNIGGAITGSDDVYINADRIGGTLTITSITTTGDIVIDADDADNGVSIGTLSGDNVDVDMSTNIIASSLSTITAKTSATVALADLQANSLTIAAKTGSTALAVAVTGGIGIDAVTISSDISTTTSITVTGDLGTGTDTLTVNTLNSGTTAKTINVSGISSVATTTLSGAGGADTIVGGAGKDRIMGSRGADTLTGNGGFDTFVINNGDSLVATPDTITDFSLGDEIEHGDSIIALYITSVAGGTSAATISTLGVATFTLVTTSTTLANKADVIDASLGDTAGRAVVFEHSGATYMFIESGNDTQDSVIKLTGVQIPTGALTDVSGSGTGLSGLGV